MARTDVAAQGLSLVEGFLNSHDVEAGTDDAGDPGRLVTWFAGHNLVAADAEISTAQWRRALDVREALRALAMANNRDPVDHAALARLNEASDAVLRVRFHGSGADLEPRCGGADRAVAMILSAVYTAMADGSWSRLKACSRHSCQWAFTDTSRNRSRTWCSMEICGNRTKAERFRARHDD